MKITVADYAGFCFGVERAVCAVESEIEKSSKLVTLGPLIHNQQVVEKLENLGVNSVDDIDNIPEGYKAVVRSHGIRKEVIEKLDQKSVEYIDMTCPYVTKIHQIVKKASDEGKYVLVAGDENHPEVQGIISYAESGYLCFDSYDDIKNFTESKGFLQNNQYILVSQTTFLETEWQKCKNFIKNTYTNVDIFDTICRATMLRQKSAAELAKISDIIIVIGGYNSSNTKKLVDVCGEHCTTVHVEKVDELAKFDLSAYSNVGVTAGASTPAFIIKEVLNSMSDVLDNNEEMSFEEMLNESFKVVNAKEKVTAIVTSVAPNEIAVDIGTKHAGYVPLFEYTDDPDADLMQLVKPGDEIELMVLRLNDAEGTALLSKKRLDAIAGFEKIEKLQEADEILKGIVIDIVKGGIIASTFGVRVFIPASQASLVRGEDLTKLKGQEVEYKILETNKSRRRAVGSIRILLESARAEQAEAFWETVEVGSIMPGVVKSLTSYGAFVDLGGVDGMVHISEISWSRIKQPSDVLSLGDEIDVIIKEVDKEHGKISLGYRKDEDNPWNILSRDYKIGDEVNAKIVSLTSFGAFAQVIPGVDGLIHISQISNERIEKPSDVLSIGQEVQAVITDIDFDQKRVSLSMRALLEPKEDESEEAKETLVAQASPDEVKVSDDLAVEETTEEPSAE